MSDDRFRKEAEERIASRNAEQLEDHDRLYKEQRSLLKAELKALRRAQRESIEGPIHETQKSVERYYDRKSEEAEERRSGLFGRFGNDKARQEEIERMEDRKAHVVQSLGAQGIEEESGRQVKIAARIQDIQTTMDQLDKDHAESMTRLGRMQEQNNERDVDREVKQLAIEEDRKLRAEKGNRAIWDRIKGQPFERNGR